jgi:hypothetical protein
MTLVKKECSNYVSMECLGIDTNGHLFRGHGKCYIEDDLNCGYYDKCISPLAGLEKKKGRRR